MDRRLFLAASVGAGHGRAASDVGPPLLEPGRPDHSLLRIWVWFWFGAMTCFARPEVSPEILFARIKAHMEENLKRLPNYTCLQTTERSCPSEKSPRFRRVDKLRLEVALADGKEMYSWPGEQKFQTSDVFDLVRIGAIGNGYFGLQAYSVFLSDAPVFVYAGDRELDGRKTACYEYKVPLAKSNYRLRVSPNEVIVGYHGSICADAQTLDLVRLVVQADDIPARLGLAVARSVIDYGRVLIGENTFLLPQSAEVVMRDLAANEYRSVTRFSACRQFTAESHLSFGETPKKLAPTRREPLSEVYLPPGLSVELALEKEVHPRKSFVGDPVTARVSRDVKKGGIMHVPKGARAHGRILRLDYAGAPSYSVVMGLRFERLEFDGRQAPFEAAIEYTAMLRGRGNSWFGGGIQVARGPGGPIFVNDSLREDAAGRFQFLTDGDTAYLPRRFVMVWKTSDGSQNKP